jgi:hypothetical protein
VHQSELLEQVGIGPHHFGWKRISLKKSRSRQEVRQAMQPQEEDLACIILEQEEGRKMRLSRSIELKATS